MLTILLSAAGTANLQTFLWVATTRAGDGTADPVNDTIWRPMCYTWVGLALLAMTNSLMANSWTMDVDISEDEVGLSKPSPAVCVSNGAYPADGLSVNVNELDNSYATEPDEDDGSSDPQALRRASRKFYFISFVSLMGQFICVYGLWVLLDTWWFKTATTINNRGTWLPYLSTELNIYMMLIGLVCMACGGSLMTNAGLTVIPVYRTSASLGEIRTEIANLEKSLVREQRSNTMKSINCLHHMTQETGGSPLLRRRRYHELPAHSRPPPDSGGRSRSNSDTTAMMRKTPTLARSSTDQALLGSSLRRGEPGQPAFLTK